MAPDMIHPPATIGILGTGQLGRMLALVARRMGYRVAVFGPGPDSPAGQVADRVYAAPYDDLDAARAFAQESAVVTYEFENIPLATALAAEELVPVRPAPKALAVSQNRQREKLFLQELRLPAVPFIPADDLDQLTLGLHEVGLPAVLKTSRSGYDGKGQVRLDHAGQAAEAWTAIGRRPAVLESLVDLALEFSVVIARDATGRAAAYSPIQNDHRAHILDLSSCPAPISTAVAEEAVKCAHIIVEALDAVGVFCVEFFLTPQERLLINEIAPRPHNSGHLTIESHITSQFEQQLRAVCGLPLGDMRQLQPAAMANLLGDLWSTGTPAWNALAAFPDVKLHLYGKHPPRPGRKMGHLTALGETALLARERVTCAREALVHEEKTT